MNLTNIIKKTIVQPLSALVLTVASSSCVYNPTISIDAINAIKENLPKRHQIIYVARNEDPEVEENYGDAQHITELFLIDVDTKERKRLTNNRRRTAAPLWSPGGDEILFCLYEWSSEKEKFIGTTYIMNADGCNKQQLIEGKAFYSPDGKIACVPKDNNIYLISEEGKKSKRLTSLDKAAHVNKFIFSPDGTKIIYGLVYNLLDPNEPSKEKIYIMDSNGHNQKILHSPLTSPNYRSSQLDWSPDNKAIYFASDYYKEQRDNLDIYNMNIETIQIKNLTNHPSDDYQPSLSPDGKELAFVSDRDRTEKIYIIDNNRPNIRVLIEGSNPSWSPDGTRIAFYKDSELWVINANGTNPEKLANCYSSFSRFQWRPSK